MESRLKYTGTRKGTQAEKKKKEKKIKKIVNKWADMIPVEASGSWSPNMLPLEYCPWEGCKVDIHNHILDAAGLLESLSVNQDFGSSSLKETMEALKIWVILDEGILEGLLLWAFKFSWGPWNPSILHDPSCWALSQYLKVADTEQAYWVWPDSYLPASPPGPVKLPGASRNHMETLQILTTLFLIKI